MQRAKVIRSLGMHIARASHGLFLSLPLCSPLLPSPAQKRRQNRLKPVPKTRCCCPFVYLSTVRRHLRSVDVLVGRETLCKTCRGRVQKGATHTHTHTHTHRSISATTHYFDWARQVRSCGSGSLATVRTVTRGPACYATMLCKTAESRAGPDNFYARRRYVASDLFPLSSHCRVIVRNGLKLLDRTGVYF